MKYAESLELLKIKMYEEIKALRLSFSPKKFI